MNPELPTINGKEVSDVLKSGREYKKVAVEHELFIAGNERRSEEDAELISELMQEENREWIDFKLASIRQHFPDLEVSEVAEVYDKGLRTYVRMCYRAHKAESPDNLDIFNDAGFMEELIFAYTFDFLQNLRQAGKQGISSRRSLEFAQKSYRHDSGTLPRLHREFPDLDPWVITHAVIGYPVTAEVFLEDVRTGMALLQEKYPQVEEGVIEKAVVYYPIDPEQRVRDLLRAIPKLAEEFPEFSESILWKAALGHPKDPVKFLRTAHKKIGELKIKYPDINPSWIEYAVTNAPASSEAYLQEALGRIAVFKKDFPEFAGSLLAAVAMHHTERGAEHLRSARDKRDALRSEYPAVDGWILDFMVINCRDPEKVLAKRLEEARVLGGRYPDVPDHFIMRSVVSSPVIAEQRIIAYSDDNK